MLCAVLDKVTPFKTAAVRPLTFYLTNDPRHAQYYWRSKDELTGDVLWWTPAILHIETPVLVDQQKLTFINSLWTPDV